jgi:hypothetical protein
MAAVGPLYSSPSGRTAVASFEAHRSRSGDIGWIVVGSPVRQRRSLDPLTRPQRSADQRAYLDPTACGCWSGSLGTWGSTSPASGTGYASTIVVRVLIGPWRPPYGCRRSLRASAVPRSMSGRDRSQVDPARSVAGRRVRRVRWRSRTLQRPRRGDYRSGASPLVAVARVRPAPGRVTPADSSARGGSAHHPRPTRCGTDDRE